MKKSTTADLQKQIAELTEKHNLQTSIEDKLPGIDLYTNLFNYKSKGTKYTFTAKLRECKHSEMRDKIRQVIEAFPPTKNNTLTFAGKDEQPTASPFVLGFKNNVRDNYTQIGYISGEYWVHIELPVSFYSDDVKGVFMRKVYDTEHHYFTGMSYKEIERIELRAYRLDMFEKVGYYGGDVTAFIKDAEDKEEFESVVLTGHTPEFSEFWQKHLEEMG